MRRGIVIALLLVAAAAAGQFGETIEVRLHQLEVIVETKDGVPVTNLTKDDFIVRQDGALQTITNFAINVEDLSEIAPATPATARAATTPEVKKREVRRYVFFIDQVAMEDKARIDFLRQSESLLRAMSPADEAMVVTPGARKRVQLFLTRDKEEVQKVLESVTRQMMRLQDMKVANFAPLPGMLDTGIPNEVEDPFFRRTDCGQSATHCAEQRIASLRAVVRSLAAIPGRKALILLSNRLSTDPTWKLNPSSTSGAAILESGKNLKPLVLEVARIAAANNVMIYPIEPYEPGLDALGGVVADQRLEGTPAALSATRGAVGVLDAFQDIARISGGRAFGGTKEFGRLFGQVVSDQSFYYSLAFPDRGARGKGHDVVVEVRGRPELVIRSRRHVVTKTPQEENRDRAFSALLLAKPPNLLAIDVSLAPQIKSGRRFDIPVTIRIPLSRLTMIRQDRAYRGSFNVYVAAQDSEKLDLGDASQNQQDVLVPAAEWETARRGHFTFETVVRVKPGRYRLSVGVTDGTSGESGFQTFEIVAGREADT